MRFEPPLDPGIAEVVFALRDAGIETFESCEGGPGHSYTEPIVRFHGSRGAGFAALAVAIEHDFEVSHLRRTWPVIDGEPTGPWWEMTFDLPKG